MSTREDAYGESDNTFVPSENLKAGLSTSPMMLITTQQDKVVDDKVLAYEVAASTTGSQGFEVKPSELRP